MAFAVAEQLIKAKFAAEFTNWPGTPVFWRNQGKQIPDGFFVQVFIQGVHEYTQAFGGGRGKNEMVTRGFVHAFVFSPLFISEAQDQGPAMRDKICDIYRNQRWSGLEFLGFSPIEGGAENSKANHVAYEASGTFKYRFRG